MVVVANAVRAATYTNTHQDTHIAHAFTLIQPSVATTRTERTIERERKKYTIEKKIKISPQLLLFLCCWAYSILQIKIFRVLYKNMFNIIWFKFNLLLLFYCCWSWYECQIVRGEWNCSLSMHRTKTIYIVILNTHSIFFLSSFLLLLLLTPSEHLASIPVIHCVFINCAICIYSLSTRNTRSLESELLFPSVEWKSFCTNSLGK